MIAISDNRQPRLPPSRQWLIQCCETLHFQVGLVLHAEATALVSLSHCTSDC